MSLREIERNSIEAYVKAAATRGLFKGKVLDYGSGKQPYRKIVDDGGGTYKPYDRIGHPASVAATSVGDDNPLAPFAQWDAILCTQVLQYLEYPQDALNGFWWALRPGGCLVLTAPTNWPIVEREDRQRFTLEGLMDMVKRRAGFETVEGHYRAEVRFEAESWPLGVGLIATKGLQ